MTFWSRIKQDLLPKKRPLTLLVGLTLLFYLILLLLSGVLDPLYVAAWGWLPVVMLPVIAIITTVSRLHNHLPEPGLPNEGGEPSSQTDSSASETDTDDPKAWVIMLETLLITIIRLAAYSAVIIPVGIWMTGRSVGVANLLDELPIPDLPWFAGMLGSAYGVIVAISIVAALMISTGFLLSRFSTWSPGILSVWITLMLFWTGLRTISAMSDWFPWVPPTRITNVSSVGDLFIFTETGFDNGPYIATFIFTVALFFLGSFALKALRQGYSGAHALEAGLLAERSVIDELQERPVPQDKVMVVSEDGETPVPAKRTWRRYGRRPAKLPDFRERLLIVIFALSALFVYDVFTQGQTITSQVNTIFARPVLTFEENRGFFLDAPFISRQGGLTLPVDDIRALNIRGQGEIQVVGTDEPHITADFVVRIYSRSAEQGRIISEHLEISLLKDGDRALLMPRLDLPNADAEIRVFYNIRLPAGVDLEINAADTIVYLAQMQNDISVQLDNSSFYGTELDGNVDILSVASDSVFMDARGSLSMDMKDGLFQIYGYDGTLHVISDGGGIAVADVTGMVTANVKRGVAAFYEIEADSTIQATNARIEMLGAHGRLNVEGKTSPILIFDVTDETVVHSDRGNVYIGPGHDKTWDFQFEPSGGELIDVDSLLSTRYAVQEGADSQAQTPLKVHTQRASIIIR